MTDNDDRRSAGGQFRQFLQYQCGVPPVQRGGGLVGEHQRRSPDQQSGHCDPLLFTPVELEHLISFAPGQTDLHKCVGHQACAFTAPAQPPERDCLVPPVCLSTKVVM